MPLPAFAALGYLGLGNESTWGTAVASSVFMEFVRDSLEAQLPRNVPPTIRQVSQRRHVAGTKMVSGDVELECHYQGFEKIWRHAFGAVTSTTIGTSSGRQHVFAINNSLPTGLTVEIDRDEPSSSNVHVYSGCKISRLRISAQPEQILKNTVSFVGKQWTTRAGVTPTFPTENPILVSQIVAQLDGGTFPGTVESIDIEINNSLIEDRKGIGSAYLLEPCRNGLIEVTGTINLWYDDTTMAGSFQANDSVYFKLNVIGTGAAIPSGGGANYTWDLEMPHVVLVGKSPTTDGPGRLRLACPFIALYDDATSADPIKLTVKNLLTGSI